jgi:hypothetical protein
MRPMPGPDVDQPEDFGVRLRWPDGDVTTALAGSVTGLGADHAPSRPTEVRLPWPS